ncbi:unnamed protein product [Linum tenue]|uniref:Uncharacterized protein n=1 Tax=Linum tenue TaxID=586396 RepID=A0AAV0Q3Q5_9ROSI|nr:unnamed protein product [Linum tenue]
MRVGSVVVEPGQPEIPQPAVEIGVQQDVAGLHISVDHHLSPFLVEVNQRGGDSFHDLASIRHVIIDQEQLALSSAVAQQLHQVPVAQPSHAGDFRYEFLHTLTGIVRDFLHRDFDIGGR